MRQVGGPRYYILILRNCGEDRLGCGGFTDFLDRRCGQTMVYIYHGGVSFVLVVVSRSSVIVHSSRLG